MDKKQIAIIFGAGFVIGSIASYVMWKNLKNKHSKSKKKAPQIKPIEEKELQEEQLSRVKKFFGDDNFQHLKQSYVVVFGVGGVGSHVVNMLVRSGVKKVKIIDFDQVSLSSLNRHACAVRGDVGKSKVVVLKNFLHKIFPEAIIETQQKYATVQNVRSLLPQMADYVIDCIDNLDAKAELISACIERGIKILVSGGAGMKNDPTKLQIRDISDVKYDNLIMRLKRELTKKGIKKGVKVAFSYQQAEKELLPLNEQQETNPESFKVFSNYRIRIVPVLGTMPAIIGMAIASYVLCELAHEPFVPFETDYVKSTSLNKIYNQLLNDERKRGVQLKDMQVDMEEVCLLTKDVYHWKCLITEKKQSNPRLTRWDPKEPATIDNLVLLGKQHYEKHNKLKSLEQVEYSRQIIQKFEQFSKKAKYLLQKGHLVYI